MRALFAALLNILLPARCLACGRNNTFLCETCLATFAPAPGPDEPNLIAVFDYADPRVRKAVWYLKYRGIRSVGETLATALCDHLIEHLAELEHYYPDDQRWLIIPVPIHPKRLAERGFNQATIIGRALAQLEPNWLEFNDRLLIKTRLTATQVSQTSRQARLTNLDGAFGLIEPDLLRGTKVILLDDVYTTGATLVETAKTIRAAGAARIVKAVIARG